MIRSKFELPEDQPIPFSSVTGEGTRELWRAVQSGLLGIEDEEDDEYPEDDQPGNNLKDEFHEQE